MNFTPPPPRDSSYMPGPRLMLRFTALAFLFFLFSPFAALPVVHGGNTIYVDSTCTLSQAVTAANTNATPQSSSCEAGSSSGRDVITLTGNVTLTTSTTSISSAVRIEGAGYTISGAYNASNTPKGYQILYVTSSGDAIVNNIHLTKGYTSSQGGAIHSRGALLVTNSTISHSVAQRGGGIAIVDGTATVANSTVYSSSATEGGGVWSRRALDLIHVTLANNRATASGGGESVYGQTTTINIRNSVITGSTSIDDCAKAGGTYNASGSFIEDPQAGCRVSGVTSGDPKLGSLTNNRYYRLASGSPALGGGDDAYCDDYSFDQAGNTRPATNCDAGSIQSPPNAPTNISVAIDELWNWVVTFDPSPGASVYQIRYQGLPYDSRGESCQNKYWCEPYNTFTATRVSVATWGLTCLEMQVRAGSGNPQSPYWGPWSHELAVRKPLWDCHGKLLNPTPGQGEDRTKTYQSRYQAVPYSYGQPQAQIAFEPEVQAARLPRDERTTLASHLGQQSGAGGAEGQSFYSGGQQSQSAQVGGAGGPQSQSVGGGGPQSQSGGGANPANFAEGANVQPTPTPLSSCKVTAEAVVNVRSEPNMNGAVLHQLAQYEVRVAKSKLGGWYEIVFPNSGTGWVSGDWVATSGDCA